MAISHLRNRTVAARLRWWKAPDPSSATAAVVPRSKLRPAWAWPAKKQLSVVLAIETGGTSWHS